MKTWLFFKLVPIGLIWICFFGASISSRIRPTPTSSASNLKIVGGTQVDIKTYPYQVSMQYSGRHVCGASILSSSFVLTAAHCTYKISASQVSFRAGSTVRTQGGQVVKAKEIHQHPKFNYDTVDYDVAVVEVTPKFTYSDRLKNVGIAVGEPKEGTLAIASGWGTLRETSNRVPNELRAVEIPVVSRALCQKIYSRRTVFTARMICAGVLFRGGKDTCQGDSGGPLVVNGKLVGVVSWGFGCGRFLYPGVYSNLNDKEIRGFIKRITQI